MRSHNALTLLFLAFPVNKRMESCLPGQYFCDNNHPRPSPMDELKAVGLKIIWKIRQVYKYLHGDLHTLPEFYKGWLLFVVLRLRKRSR